MYQQGEETDTRWGPEVKLKCRDLSVASHMDKKTIVLLASFKAELKKSSPAFAVTFKFLFSKITSLFI